MSEPKKQRAIPWGVVFAVASTVSLIALAYYYVYNRELGAERTRLLKERASLAAQIADDYGALRGKLEPWAVALATQPWPGELVDNEAKSLAWRERPVMYLRLRGGDATSNESVHVHAKLTSLDGLSACLLRSKGPGPWAYGDIASRAEFLGSDFIRDVKETRNDLRLRQLTYALEQYKLRDWPEARDASKLAELAVIVIDEDPPQIPSNSPLFGADASVHQKILGTAHPIRLSLRRLADGRELLRIRRTPEATLMQVAGDPTANAAALEVRKVQALGCAMANETLELSGLKPGPEIVANPPPLPALAAPALSMAATPSAAPMVSASASASK